VKLPYLLVDAFASLPFQGNPAAVCLPETPLPAVLMQAVAGELNLSETAFPEPPGPDGVRRLRWFTPTVEVPLCGHATLAAAHALFARGAAAPFRFSSASGLLEVRREEDGALTLDFPADPPAPAPPPAGLLEALGAPVGAPVSRGKHLWVVCLDSAEDVLAVTPDTSRLAGVDPAGALGVSVTAPGEKPVDFVSRFFGPWVGVDEDPVTGMAHCVLGPHWGAALGRKELAARQLSRRGGDLQVSLQGDRVLLSGYAVTVAEGFLHLP